LLDDQALLACLAYVDLNPVRAGIAKTPEASKHTSIRRRVKAATSSGRVAGVKGKQPEQLQPFAGYPRQPMPAGLAFRLKDYLELVDWTGRAMREDKKGSIHESLPALLERLQIEPDHWLYMTKHYESCFSSLVGTIYSLKRACQQLGLRRIRGRTTSEELFSI